MKTWTIAALVVLPISCTPQSQPPKPPPSSPDAVQNTLSADERDSGWRLLFDGKTTTGWRNYGKPTISDGWKAQNGTLTRVGAGGDIITTDQFRNWSVVMMSPPAPTRVSVPSRAFPPSQDGKRAGRGRGEVRG